MSTIDWMENHGFIHSVRFHDGGGVSHRLGIPKKRAGGSGGVGGPRGTIDGASRDSERRLRRFLLEYEPRGAQEMECWAVTLTLRHHLSAEIWRHCWAVWSQQARRSGWPVVWRVELQRRGVPHLHLVTWGPESMCEAMREKWLKVWGIAHDPDHCAYAVDWRSANGGWFGYVALHQAKHSEQGAGWQGRHWGVLNKELFVPRETMVHVLTPTQYQYVRRFLSWIYQRRGRRSDLPFISSWDALGEDRMTVERVVKRAIRYLPGSSCSQI